MSTASLPASLPTGPRPAALTAWPAAQRAALLGLMTDIDDTLTRDGSIEPAALDALHALSAAGLPVIAITGRPAGWSEPCVRQWPVAAIVAENGAVALRRSASGGVRRDFVQDAARRAAHAARLQAVGAQILAEVPGATLARDSAGRLTDLAIDHSEFTTLPPPAIERVVSLMQAAGLTATVSSIHVNGWIGTHDKFSGACWVVELLYGRRLQDELERWAWVGDSTNDQAMFARLPHSVGVANLLRFAGELHTWPRYLTRAERGRGFAEVAQAVLAARGAT